MLAPTISAFDPQRTSALRTFAGKTRGIAPVGFLKDLAGAVAVGRCSDSVSASHSLRCAAKAPHCTSMVAIPEIVRIICPHLPSNKATPCPLLALNVLLGCSRKLLEQIARGFIPLVTLPPRNAAPLVTLRPLSDPGTSLAKKKWRER